MLFNVEGNTVLMSAVGGTITEQEIPLLLATALRCSLKRCCWCGVSVIENQHFQGNRAMLPQGTLPFGDNSTGDTEIYISIPGRFSDTDVKMPTYCESA